MGPNWVLSDSDWGGPTLKNRSGVPIGAILSALAPRQARETHAPCSHTSEVSCLEQSHVSHVKVKVFNVQQVLTGQLVASGKLPVAGATACACDVRRLWSISSSA